MDYFKKVIWGPDPKEQHRQVKAALRKNGRQIDKSLVELQGLQNKTKQLIKKAAKKDDTKGVRIYAKELYQINKQYSRMYTSKAQLQSVGMKIEEAYKMKTITNQMATSASLMREVNMLVHLPQLRNTMVELEKELMKAGIISEMIDDSMEDIDTNEEMDEEIDEEVNKIVEQYTTEKFSKINNIPTAELPAKPQEEVPENQVEEEADKMLDDMRERLRALQN